MKVAEAFFPVSDYDLAATLSSGQAFRWQLRNGAWEGVVGQRWVRLTQRERGVTAEAMEPVGNWEWLRHYLQLEIDLASVLATFPDDEPMRVAVAHCRGLRLLRQDPWECLASFILSSTKQIVQIQQIVAAVCGRFGGPVATPAGHEPVRGFPSAAALARCSEADLRACKMGFRAPYLLASSRRVAEGKVDLGRLSSRPLAEARDQLMELSGVGRKIADCVLLFACGFPTAFPVDVWILKALRPLYFPRRRPTMKRLLQFSETHFGPNGGYAQQYLFHYMRTKRRAAESRE